ncbi:GGDEF domain-containing protein [Kineococcus sp. SYSU DK002]|uniref:GGDEF domain-containing protein n=1 Tax=Kineococcus sp. SYSU DK002 TaxID=3383123 RepID=UPI003D7D98EB
MVNGAGHDGGDDGGDDLHRVLSRQLRRAGADRSHPPGPREWQRFLAVVSSTYTEHDRSRYVLERAMRISTEEMQQLHKELRSRALVDALTGIANRAGILETLEHVVAERAVRRRVTVLFLDLDGFKGVNDRHGHGAGDELLAAAAGRIRSRSRPTDVVGRLGGDEFLVVRVGEGDEDAAAQRVADALAAPFRLSCGTVRVSASVGVASGTTGERTAADFVQAADDAMYAAKAAGKNRVVAVDLDAARDGAARTVHG